MVQSGLTLAGIKWVFTAVVVGNRMPVTLLSHMLDVETFGLHSGAHHLVNVIFHALSAWLLFAVLERATRARAASAFVAFLFALHPLHVESVAWIAERKDVLSTFFSLALYAYVRYAEQPGVRRYLMVVASFCFGPDVEADAGHIPLRPPAVRLLAAPPGRVAENRLGKTSAVRAWIQASQVVAALVILVCVSAAVILACSKRPYQATGWFWCVGTLVPVTGIVKIGQQSHADRYTYIPSVGLSIMLAWGAAEITARWPRMKSALAAAAAICCALCLLIAWRQVAYWQNGGTLFQHAIDATGDNWLAE